MSADLVYVILFPQLLVALFDRKTTAQGAVVGAIVGSVLRFLSEPWVADRMFGPGAIEHWPVRTLAMLSSLLTILVVSRAMPPKRILSPAKS